ncbi:MAG TPA: hypothetical protein VGM53_11440 [Streptosporangiaceae bacterium]|jgi:hypothetical protein
MASGTACWISAPAVAWPTVRHSDPQASSTTAAMKGGPAANPPSDTPAAAKAAGRISRCRAAEGNIGRTTLASTAAIPGVIRRSP